MSKTIQLHIPEPCHENWHNMTPQEQGRFCGSCQKTVVDFSAMSDKEILDYFSNASQHTCGRFSNEQLNRDINVAENKRRFSWAYIWNVLLATFLVTESYAQGQPAVKGKPVIKTRPAMPKKPAPPEMLPTMGTIAVVEPDELPPPTPEICGVVMDRYTKTPVIGASIWIKGSTKGTVADTNGIFHLPVDKTDTVTLEITCVGYEAETVILDSKSNWQDLKVLMGETEAFMGLIVVEKKVPKKEKLKRTVNNWVPAALKKDIKVYPNPVVRGNTIQANVSLKQTGSYKLELIDVNGRVMALQKLVMTTKEQQVTIPTEAGWSSGIYWIRITAPGVKNVYQAKVSIQ
jgi:hypothetical protein